MDMNKVFLIGRLTANPEIRVTQNNTSLAKFSLALNRRYRVNEELKEEVSYFNCTVWGKQVDVVRQYCQKGKQIAVEGRLQQSRWQDAQGQNRSAVEIVVESFQLLGGGDRNQVQNDGGDGIAGYSGGYSRESISDHEPPGNNIKEPLMDDDIPF